MAKGKTWTLQELNYLSNNYEFGKSKEIAKKLGRSTVAIREKARRLGLTKNERAVVVNGVYQESVHDRLEREGKANMKKYGITVKAGDKVEIIGENYESKRLGTKKVVKGKVVYKSKNYITVQRKRYKESFLISDFYTGVIKLVNKGGQAACN